MVLSEKLVSNIVGGEFYTKFEFRIPTKSLLINKKLFLDRENSNEEN